jgi:hypothetical protein
MMVCSVEKAVIFPFMAGGPSHLDTFDPKPLLNKLEGQTRPKEFGEAKYQFVERNGLQKLSALTTSPPERVESDR